MQDRTSKMRPFRKLLMTGVAALFLATGAAHATGPDNCAVVVKTRDGFLNVRAAPTMKSKIVARINPADIVHDDAYEDTILEFDESFRPGKKASRCRPEGCSEPDNLSAPFAVFDLNEALVLGRFQHARVCLSLRFGHLLGGVGIPTLILLNSAFSTCDSTTRTIGPSEYGYSSRP